VSLGEETIRALLGTPRGSLAGDGVPPLDHHLNLSTEQLSHLHGDMEPVEHVQGMVQSDSEAALSDLLAVPRRFLAASALPPRDHHLNLSTEQLSHLHGDMEPLDHHLSELLDHHLSVSLSSPRVAQLSHSLLSPSLVSTGVEACVDSFDDFTQTDVEDDVSHHGSLHISQLAASGASLTSSTHSDTSRIRAELDRLHQERVEIIELLQLRYLPASLTVELLEAKLNYCLGQTDTLLQSLERHWAWDEDDSKPKPMHEKHEQLLVQYREQLEQSRRDLSVCVEKARRVQNGTRGRRMARTRDVIAMKRRAEIEAFMQERELEQALYDQHRQVSPSSQDSDGHDSDPKRQFAPRYMTPTQHKRHLVKLRQTLVAASTEELDILRQRSRSNSSSASHDFSPASSLPLHSRDSSLASFLSPERRSDLATASLSPPSTSHLSATHPPPRIPRLVLPTSDPSYHSHSTHVSSHSSGSAHHHHHHRGYSADSTHFSHSYRPQPSLAPRSNSCGTTHLSTTSTQPRDFHSQYAPYFDVGDTSAYASGGESLDPEQLLKESYAARQLNREQISKAQQALRLLEEHRTGFRNTLR
jgi:hypothetical protein